MKLNEKQLRNIIKSIIRESLGDLNTTMAYAQGGNGNVFNDNGRAGMAALGEYGDEMQGIAMRDNGEGYYSPYDEEGEYWDEKDNNEWDNEYKMIDENKLLREFDEIATLENLGAKYILKQAYNIKKQYPAINIENMLKIAIEENRNNQ